MAYILLVKVRTDPNARSALQQTGHAGCMHRLVRVDRSCGHRQVRGRLPRGKGARVFLAYTVMVYEVMACIVMAYMVLAYMVMICTVMTYIDMIYIHGHGLHWYSLYSYGLYSHGLYNYGLAAKVRAGESCPCIDENGVPRVSRGGQQYLVYRDETGAEHFYPSHYGTGKCHTHDQLLPPDCADPLGRTKTSR